MVDTLLRKTAIHTGKTLALSYFSTLTGIWSAVEILTYFKSDMLKQTVGAYWASFYIGPIAVALVIAFVRARSFYASGKNEIAVAGRAEDMYLPLVKNGTTYLNRFVIKSHLSQGGFSSVYHAWDDSVKPGREVVLKLVKTNIVDKARKRFAERELDICRKLVGRDIKGVIKIYEVNRFRDQPGACIVQEYPGGARSLRDEIRNSGPMEEKEALQVGKKICAALEQIHALRIIHGDLSPLNILIDSESNPTVIDFGISRYVGEKIHSDEVMATRHFTDPGLIDQTVVDARNDIYSVGALLLYMATSWPDAVEDTQCVTKLADAGKPAGEGPEAKLDSPLISPALKAVVGSCLRVEGTRPITDMRQLAAALDSILSPA